MADISVVIDKLHGFETADDLAEFFRGYGIVALPRDARSCAITKFVVEETGLTGIVTNTHSVNIYEDERLQDDGQSFEHTKAMMDFVEMFDQGYYPDLVEAGYVFESDNDSGCSCCTDY